VCVPLDYSDVIYDNCSNIDSTKIENIQRRACIILTGAIRVTKHKTLLKEAGVEPLKRRRKFHRFTYLFKEALATILIKKLYVLEIGK
jgi:hypothetical protein